MPKGPRLNVYSKSFTGRDSLGIDGVETSIQNEICPVITTVTPKAFYWAFLVWIYYDFYEYSGVENKNYNEFYKYLRRQDYFFVLATLLNASSEVYNLAGQTKALNDINNSDGPYYHNDKYLQAAFGGMANYYPGCVSLHFISEENPEEGIRYPFPKLRKEGKELAKAFESVIKDTEYYRSFRRNDLPVPKDVLIDYGKVIDFDLKGFDECKKILDHYFFDDDINNDNAIRSRLLSDCRDYITLFVKNYGISNLYSSTLRRLIYDHETPDGNKISIPENLVTVSNRWEIAIGRMYFTIGLGMIWKQMLFILSEAMTFDEWFSLGIRKADFSVNLDGRVEDIFSECNYDFATREEMIRGALGRSISSDSIENGLKIMISVYNRFYKRQDLGEDERFLYYNNGGQSISFFDLFNLLDDYKERSLSVLLSYIFKEWLIDQHIETATTKALQGRDGFFIEIVDNRYIKKYDFEVGFQGIRLEQLAQVMKTLDLI